MQEIFFVHDQQESPVPRKDFLEMAGFRVTAMRSGAECFEALEQRTPDLVMLDVLLEGPNGFEVCRRIRERFTAAELPVVLGSMVYRSRVYRDEAFACGAQLYVVRPAKLDDLVAQIRTVLAARAAPTRTA